MQGHPKNWPALGHYAELPWLGGIHTFHLSGEQARRYLQDPAEVIAELVGCDLATYEEWRHWQGRYQCHGKTKAGKRCKATVPGVLFSSPSEYARYGGGYCSVHGGA